MAWYRAGGGGIPSSLKTGMNSVLNKKFGTSTTYDPAGWPDDVNLLGKLPEKTVSGTIAHITDGADEVPIKSWEVEIAPTLSGVSSVVETQTGRNLFSYDLPLYEGYWLNGFQGTGNEVNYATATGWLFYKIPVKEGATITFSGMQALGGVYCAFFKDTPDNVISTFLNGSINGTRQVPAGANFVGVEINRGGTPQRDPKTEYPQAQIEYGSTAHTYEPYQTPTVYTADLGRTIYGGTADVVKGTGKSTRIKKTVRWGDLGNTTVLADYTRKEIVLSADEEPKYTMASASTDLICDKISTYDMTYSGNFEHMYIANSTRIWIYMANDTDADTQISVSYTLTDALQADFTFTPISPTPETALGVNNFWADAGDSEVTYRADIDLALGGN